MQRALCFSLVLAALFPALGVRTATAAAPPAPRAHHLKTDPRSPAFVFGIKGGGESVTGTFTVTIYVGGRVKLKKSTEGKVRLVNPGATVDSAGLHGLLKLAEAEGFFAMPPSTTAQGTLADVPAAFISIYTREGTKTVTVRGANVAAFYELYAILNYVAGATS
jgi:hypothetical protein